MRTSVIRAVVTTLIWNFGVSFLWLILEYLSPKFRLRSRFYVLFLGVICPCYRVFSLFHSMKSWSILRFFGLFCWWVGHIKSRNISYLVSNKRCKIEWFLLWLLRRFGAFGCLLFDWFQNVTL